MRYGDAFVVRKHREGVVDIKPVYLRLDKKRTARCCDEFPQCPIHKALVPVHLRPGIELGHGNPQVTVNIGQVRFDYSNVIHFSSIATRVILPTLQRLLYEGLNRPGLFITTALAFRQPGGGNDNKIYKLRKRATFFCALRSWHNATNGENLIFRVR